MLATTRNTTSNDHPDGSRSPARKKPRLSTEGERDSQRSRPRLSSSSQASPGAKARRRRAIEMALGGGHEEHVQSSKTDGATFIDPSDEVIPSSQEEPQKAHDADSVIDLAPPTTTTPSTTSLDTYFDEHDNLPEREEEPNIAEWFQPSASQATFVPAFQIHSGTTSRVCSEWTVPSQQALEVASQRLKKWQEEDPEEATPSTERKVLGSVENVPPSASLAITPAKFYPPLLRSRPTLGSQNITSSPGGFGSTPSTFRPRLNSLTSAVYPGSPLNPNGNHSISTEFSSPQLRPASSFGFATPGKPVPSLSLTPRSRPARTAFATPFKSGVKPGMPLRTPANLMQQKLKEQAAVAAERERKVEEKRKKEREIAVFDLTPPPGRHSMEWHGVLPKSYSAEDIYRLGIPAEIPSINLRNAQYYRFNAPTFSQVASGSAELRPLGTNDALTSLREKGCNLATPEWVDNHWGMILWKLASLICAYPNLLKDKWTYHEVVNQLLYRYERELNRVQRPAFRLITEGDTPSTKPMVICVSVITPGEGGMTAEGEAIEGLPVLDVTDGWYRLRATIDEPLTRAIKRGILKVGTKIAVSGAKLQGGKDGVDPLTAYTKGVHLQLYGNSTTLARWNTKLGFRNSPLPFIATLRSLTADGGPVMLMDIIITKSFPVGYLESSKMEGVRPIPKCELEEKQEENAWQNRRSNEEIKLRDAFEKRMGRFEAIAERLEGVSRGFKPPTEDYPPDHVEDIYDGLEDAQDPNLLIKSLSPQDCGWLASVIRTKMNAARERSSEVISKELDDVCPPRQVRNFCIIRFRDNRVSKHQPMREGQLTVWDVLALGPDAMAEGKRYFVTNVVPSSPTSWSQHDINGEAYFITRRDTRWTALSAST
ncbi:hypothetical protein FRB95_006397 [Tulasnella sp. JGI-2019a]|nr:hypothetical protein FRB95_006397 [Tulasnella sp. JGI-2019a]